MTETISKLFWIARYTFLEISKSRLIYAIFMLGFFIWLVAYVAAEFTYGVPERVSLDFGMGMLSLSSLGVSIFLGSTLIYKEIENRTVYIVLTKPTSRSTFLMGKILGLIAVIILNTAILGFFTLSCYFFQGGQWNSMAVWAIAFTIIESVAVLMAVIFFSLLTNPILTALYGIGFAVVAHALNEINQLFFVRENPLLQIFLGFLGYIIPNLSAMNLRSYLLYENAIEFEKLAMAAGSVCVYTFAMALLCCFIFSKKQFE